MDILTGEVLMNEKDFIRLRALAVTPPCLESAQQQLQIGDFAQLDVGRETHPHLQRQRRTTFELQRLLIKLHRDREAEFLALLLRIRRQSVGADP